MMKRYLVTEAEARPDAGCGLGRGRLGNAVERARTGLERLQKEDGHWVFELEADCTIPAEYVLMMHFMDEIDTVLEQRLAVFMRSHQAAHGGWPLYAGGDFDISCSVKAYYALKLIGDSPEAAHMLRAREAILAHGGAAASNVFTRITLALFGQVPWRAVPFIPVEIMLLPRWFPFHVSKVSYWSRTVMVPLFILCSLKPKAKNPRAVDIRDLFVTPPEEEQDYFRVKTRLGRVFLVLDRLGRALEPVIPRAIRRHAIQRAESWFTERLNGTDGLGGIFPAMVNAYEALVLLGYPKDHPYCIEAKEALKKLLVAGEDSIYCQPCVSPVWDTAIAANAVFEANGRRASTSCRRALNWLQDRQLGDEPGDWRETRPDLKGGGWAFQYANPHYPDLDDTSMVGWAMCLIDPQRYKWSTHAAAEWIHGMRSKNGGYGSFDADNTCYYLNHIPFADHGALLDPPTSDVTARCIALLVLAGEPRYKTAIAAAIGFLRNEQEADGSWFGRWGTNYIYGTWSVLSALRIAGEDPSQPYLRRAVEWLKSMQQSDGGWGESNGSYFPAQRGEYHPSTAFQTAWALLGLMAAGEVRSEAVRRGIDYLLTRQGADGLWHDEGFTAPGFPRVFYLKYHGYTKYFPLWAMAQFRNLTLAARD
ncbi:MAG: Squalene--hopene cyclase [Chromatiales bacterium USCg_Taylor]|nr:MAG: Squalene--hopene cyclase [Chromatiales bacterium USCg_Taylor]